MRPPVSLIAGVLALVVGALFAHSVQTGGGAVAVEDVRFTGTGGVVMSGLLYVPRNASAAAPVPGVLAVHGYINSRETQSGFAIELARRGFVVLALDQTGHGFSAPPAFANGFGGPDGLAYLRVLPMVDPTRIGLEGHSMGGWAVLSAAAADPDGYASMVLEGSSTGSFGAPEGTAAFPRNVAVVFSAYDEFAELMWDVPTAARVNESAKLQALFGITGPVERGRVYGDADSGTARVLFTPAVTHPGDHHSTVAIGHAVEWFDRTLGAPEHRAAGDQVWYWKELGTLLALIGVVALLIGLTGAGVGLVSTAAAGSTAAPTPDRWTVAALFLLPAVTYLPLFKLAERVFPPSQWFPQQITNGVITWVVGNALITAVLLFVTRRERTNVALSVVPRALILAICAVGITYLALFGVFSVFAVDARVWVVALKPLASWHWSAFFVYLLPMLAFFPLLGAAVSKTLVPGDSVVVSATKTALLLSGGFVVFLLIQYVPLFLVGTMPLGEPLLSIIAFQFVALLAIVGVITAVFLRRTGSVWTGGFVNALFVTWLVVAGQATHVAG